MSRVQIIGYINPICGNDETAVPCDPSLPYATIDFFYNQQRLLNPDAELTAEVQNHLVALNGVFYTFLNVTNPSKNARLSIRGREDGSILFNAVTLQIDTDILVPEINNTEEPIIRTGTSFEVQGGYRFNVINELLNFNNPINRAAFDHNGFNLDDIEYPPGRVFIRQSRSEIMTTLLVIHERGIAIDIDFPILMEVLNTNIYYLGNEDQLDKNFVLNENATFNYHSSGVVSPFQEPVFSGTQCISNPPSQESIYSQLSGNITLQGDYAIGPNGQSWRFYTELVPQTVQNRSKENRMAFYEKYKNHPDPYVKEMISKMQNGDIPTTRMIQGGTVINKANNGTAFLTNAEDMNVVNVNCDDVVPFEDESVQKQSEYILQQESNSINYSGSTFQQGKLINSVEYTHTQFDGTTFIIDNSQHDVTIFIPIGMISNDRYFQYKLLYQTDNKVIIRSPGLVDGKKKLVLRRDGKCNHGSALLYGFNNTILIMN